MNFYKNTPAFQEDLSLSAEQQQYVQNMIRQNPYGLSGPPQQFKKNVNMRQRQGQNPRFPPAQKPSFEKQFAKVGQNLGRVIYRHFKTEGRDSFSGTADKLAQHFKLLGHILIDAGEKFGWERDMFTLGGRFIVIGKALGKKHVDFDSIEKLTTAFRNAGEDFH